MLPQKPPFEDISGYIGIGSLELLGTFFVLDGLFGFLTFVEQYSKTNTWAILVTVPTLVVAYVLGLLSSLGVELLLKRLSLPVLTPAVFAYVANSGNDLLAGKYADAERHSRFLCGNTAAFVFLALGSLIEVPMMGEYGFVGYIGLAAGLSVAGLCPLLARQIQAELVQFAEAVGFSNGGARESVAAPGASAAHF